jgi:hypothetical protein
MELVCLPTILKGEPYRMLTTHHSLRYLARERKSLTPQMLSNMPPKHQLFLMRIFKKIYPRRY